MKDIVELTAKIQHSLNEKDWPNLAQLDGQLRQVVAAELDHCESPDEARDALVHLQELYRQLCIQAQAERDYLKSQINSTQVGRKAANSYSNASRY